jgi:hypothetical protein
VARTSRNLEPPDLRSRGRNDSPESKGQENASGQSEQRAFRVDSFHKGSTIGTQRLVRQYHHFQNSKGSGGRDLGRLKCIPMSSVIQILTAAAPTVAMESRPSVRAVPGKGLVGDRYYVGTGTFSPLPQKPEFELTLIEREQIERFARESGLPFTAQDARRNIVTEGIDLNALVGREFLLGKVRARGIELCEPCTHLAKLSFPETLDGLVHKAGLRAQVLSEGTISVGDAITVID